MKYNLLYVMFLLIIILFIILNKENKIYENMENAEIIMIEQSGEPNMKFAKLPCNSETDQSTCIKILKNKKLKIINLFPENSKGEGDVNYTVFFKTTNTSDLPKLIEFKSWFSEYTSSGTFNLPAGKTKYVKFPHNGVYTFQNKNNPSVFGGNAGGIKSSFQIISI